MTAAAVPRAPILVLLGPTGTGKSATAMSVARALDGEIVGCDALQVYRGLDAATAKPTPAERAAVPHHLVDCVDPRTDYTMADYVRAAADAVAAVLASGRVPLVVGGTGLYLRCLLRGFVAAPGRDAALRARLRRIVERGGATRLHAWLERTDPASARRIAATDVQRLVRAIELVHADGAAWSERLGGAGDWSAGDERYRACKIGLDRDRDEHAKRLDRRVDDFFESGLVAEVRGLLEQGVPRDANAFKAIGYREVVRAIERGEDPESVRGEVRRNTRRLAKRQRSWFRAERGVVWLDAAVDRDEVVGRILDLWHDHVGAPPRGT
jgi:tRNA dimethylallyltransferase